MLVVHQDYLSLTTDAIMTMFSGHLTAVSAESYKGKIPEEWTNRFTQQLTSIVDALSVLYDGLEKDGDVSLTNVTLTDKESFPEVATTFTQHCENLFCMMSEPTNGLVRLPLGPLLSAVSRCLRVSYVDVRTVPSMSELAGILPALHRAALEILSQLVLSCKTSVLPHSRVIIDLCMQALTSARHMDISARSKTRAYAYQALCLIVQTFGWGNYMTHQCKSFIQELMTDIKWQNSSKQASATNPSESNNKRQFDTAQGKKKGRKKKNRAESYVDLVKINVTEGKTNKNGGAYDFQVTVGALELAKLMLEQVGFVSVESLMKCIVDTAQMLHHEEPPAYSPYTIVLCRKVLHTAVFACATVRLEPDCSRKDAITHFQLTNLALSILVNGMQNNSCYEVQSVCRESMRILQVTESLNRPIVRRIQPQENHSTIDEMELEGEIEKVREENVSLQSRLLNSDMEIQTMKNKVASLRKELDTLKASRSNMDSQVADMNVYLSDPDNSKLLTNDSEDLLVTDFVQDESETEENMKKQAEGEGIEKFKDGTENEQQLDYADRELTEHSEAAEGNKQEEGTSQESLVHNRLSQAKRKYSLEQNVVSSEETKRSKVDFSNNVDSPVTDAIQDMINDFVDADPDAPDTV